MKIFDRGLISNDGNPLDNKRYLVTSTMRSLSLSLSFSDRKNRNNKNTTIRKENIEFGLLKWRTINENAASLISVSRGEAWTNATIAAITTTRF